MGDVEFLKPEAGLDTRWRSALFPECDPGKVIRRSSRPLTSSRVKPLFSADVIDIDMSKVFITGVIIQQLFKFNMEEKKLDGRLYRSFLFW
jgi:hypothetical protein